MNIQLIGKQGIPSLKLQNEKIVYVRIVERKENKATIEINGQKLEARLEADTPENFLALVENSPSEKDKNTIILRIISAATNKQILKEIQEQNISKIIKDFFIENNLPLREDLIKIAIKMYLEGIKLSREWIKFLNIASMKYGESFANIIFQFLKSNLNIDLSFPEFFFYYRNILKKLLDNALNAKEKREGENYGKDIIPILKNLFSIYFGKESLYNISFLDFEKETIIIQSRKEKKKNGERYYFDCSSRELGNILLIIDIEDNYYDIKLYIEDFLYKEIANKFEERVEEKSKEISKMIQNKSVFISLNRLANPLIFWERSKEDDSIEKNIMCNIDISV